MICLQSTDGIVKSSVIDDNKKDISIVKSTAIENNDIKKNKEISKTEKKQKKNNPGKFKNTIMLVPTYIDYHSRLHELFDWV